MDIRSDFHTHTNLSACAPESTTVQALLDGLCSGPDGVRVLGISNHLWDADVPGASPWYAPQDVPHVLSIRSQLEGADTHGARVLIGAEVEFSADLRIALTEEHAKLFDYVLITANHVHMKDFIIPSSMTDPYEISDYIVMRFKAAAKVPMPVKCGIVHPFSPLSFKDDEIKILSHITDGTYGECFELAAEYGKSIELHPTAFSLHLPLNDHGFCDEYIRMLGIAHECGCTFHIGSDVHSPKPESGLKLRELAKYLGLTEYDLTDF